MEQKLTDSLVELIASLTKLIKVLTESAKKDL